MATTPEGPVRDLDGHAQRFLNWFAESRVVTLGIFLLGAAVRFVPFLFNRSLWHDEANITLDVMERSALQLFEPTKLYEQTAPIGWLITEWVSGHAFAFSELGMRGWPFVSGILALPLFWLVARRAIGPLGTQIGLLLLAVGLPAIRYANEVKPYSSDLAFILLVYLIGFGLLVREPSRSARVAAAVGGAVMIWFSHVTVFGLAAVGVLGLVVRWQHRDMEQFKRDLPVWILWVVSLAVCYFTYLNRLIQDSELTDYWEVVEGYAPLVPRSVQDVLWYSDTFMYLFRHTAGIPAAELGAFFFILGAAVLWRRQRVWLAMFILPVLLALLASGFGKYAFTGRLILFAAPCVLLLVGSAFDFLSDRCGRVSAWVVGIGAVILLIGPLYDVAYQTRNPVSENEVREALDYLDEHAATGDVIYLSSGTLKPYLYYSRVGRFTRDIVINGNRHGHNHFDWDRVTEDLKAFEGKDRVWVLFSGVWRAKGLDEEEVFLETARGLGMVKQQQAFAGVNIYLFDFSE